jgi:branched-chain amino acid transport system permease protein
MMLLAQSIINGLLLGGLYGVAAVGFSMVWGVMGIINLAHGAYIMIGAFVSFLLFTYAGVDPFVSIPVAMAVLFAVGYAVQAWILNPVMRTSLLLTLALTFGLDLVIVDGFNLIFSSNFRAVNTGYSSASIAVGSVLIPYVRLATFGIALILAATLYLFMNRTKSGQAILATALDREVARLMGINPERVFALTAGAGAALAGGAGALASMLFPISPAMGLTFIGAVFVITVLGGVGNVPGAVVAGFVYGMIQSIASMTLGVSYQEIVAFSLFLAIIIFRPQGLFGRRLFGEAQ